MPFSRPAVSLLRRLLAVISPLTLPLIALLLGLALPQPAIAGSISADGWEQIDPLPQTNSLHGVTWGGGQFVAVGWAGTIITSPDGRQWTVRASPTTSTLMAVAWNPSGYIAVGYDGTIIFSNDGISWEPRPSGFTGFLADVAASLTQFVIVGADGFLASGTGNGSWTTGHLGINTLGTAHWNGAQFLVGNNEGDVSISADGVNWSEFRYAAPCLSDVAWNGNVYAAIGDRRCWGDSSASPENFIDLLNADGAFQSRVFDAYGYLSAAAWDGDRFIVIGSFGTIVSSPTGTDWSWMQSGVDLFLLDIAVSATTSVVVGEAGAILVRSTPASSAPNAIPTLGLISTILLVAVILLAAYRRGKLPRESSFLFLVVLLFGPFLPQSATAGSISADGWELIDPPIETNLLTDIVWGGGQFVAVGEHGVIITSPDGRQWTAQTSGTSNSLRAVTWGLGKYIVVGDQGTVLASTDGISWVPENSGTTRNLRDVAVSPTQFVAVGDEGATTTSSGNGDWAPLVTVYGNFKSILWNGSHFIAATLEVLIVRNSDTDWSIFGYFDVCLVDFAWNGKIYAAVGIDYCWQLPPAEVGDEIDIVSADGSFISTPYMGGGGLYAVAWTGSRFVAAGKHGKILVSSNGIAWTQLDSGVDIPLSAIASSETVTVVVGGDGVILLQANPPPPAPEIIPTIGSISLLILAIILFVAGYMHRNRNAGNLGDFRIRGLW